MIIHKDLNKENNKIATHIMYSSKKMRIIKINIKTYLINYRQHWRKFRVLKNSLAIRMMLQQLIVIWTGFKTTRKKSKSSSKPNARFKSKKSNTIDYSELLDWSKSLISTLNQDKWQNKHHTSPFIKDTTEYLNKRRRSCSRIYKTKKPSSNSSLNSLFNSLKNTLRFSLSSAEILILTSRTWCIGNKSYKNKWLRKRDRNSNKLKRDTLSSHR